MPTAAIVGWSQTDRTELRTVLKETGSIEVVAEAAGGAEGIRGLHEVSPDIVLISEHLQDMTWDEVVRDVASDTGVILLADTDRHALAAFEAGVVDYVRVPFTSERLAQAVERAARHGAKPKAERAPERFASGGLRRLFLRERDGIVPVRVERIVRFEADGDYVVVHLDGRRHLVRLRLQDLEDGLGERFLRAHRSHLVNLDHVRIFEHHEDGRLVVVMDDGTRIMASRSRSRALRSLAR